MQAGGSFGQEPVGPNTHVAAHSLANLTVQALLYLAAYRQHIPRPSLGRGLGHINHAFVDALHAHMGRVLTHNSHQLVVNIAVLRRVAFQHHQPWAQAPRLMRAHTGAYAAGFGLVAGGNNGSMSTQAVHNCHRPATQSHVGLLLHGCKAAIEVDMHNHRPGCIKRQLAAPGRYHRHP